MGADLIVECFWEEIDDHGKALVIPDWEKGRKKIQNYCDSMRKSGNIDDEVQHLGNDVDSIQQILEDYLSNAEEAWNQTRRDVACLEFRPYRIYITAGMSWGDAPSDLYYPLEMMNRLSILEEVGLNPELPNTRRIVNTLVKSKDLQPLLIGKDPDLDKLLDKEIRHGTNIRKRQVPPNTKRPSGNNKKPAKARR
jgi:hypothetical protein